MRSFTFVI
jgi:hypothetical protein